MYVFPLWCEGLELILIADTGAGTTERSAYSSGAGTTAHSSEIVRFSWKCGGALLTPFVGPSTSTLARSTSARRTGPRLSPSPLSLVRPPLSAISLANVTLQPPSFTLTRCVFSLSVLSLSAIPDRPPSQALRQRAAAALSNAAFQEPGQQ